MSISRFKALLGATALAIVSAGIANAGGFSRGTADTDILFEQGNFNLRTSATIVSPTRKFTDVGFTGQEKLLGVDFAETYVIPSAAVKLKFFDNLSCAGTFSTPYGGSSAYPIASGRMGKLKEELVANEFGATCALQFDMGKGRFSFLGGVFVEQHNYELVMRPDALGGVLTPHVKLKGSDTGWRAGVAYEIPEIAMRTQLMYRSGTTVDADGAVVTPFSGGALDGAAHGAGEMPQSLELKAQSGIAPGWLAFGSVKWTDYSVLERLDLTTNVALAPGVYLGGANLYYYKDGWTVTGGVGHAFTDAISGLVSFTWDKGVTTGWDTSSTTYTLASGLSFKDKIGGELRAGVGLTYLTSASETKYDPTAHPLLDPTYGYNRTVGSDWSYAASLGYAVKW